MEFSSLQNARYLYKPKLPPVFAGGIDNVSIELIKQNADDAAGEVLHKLFPRTFGKPMVNFVTGSGSTKRNARTVGVILSGGQAPGGHNVIAGLFDGLKACNANASLIGFLGGPSGLVDNKAVVLSEDTIARYRNTGGFDMIGSGRTKIETQEQFAKVSATVQDRKLDALVIIGGDDSNTNAALLAEYFEQQTIPCALIGVPKTIDGDLKNEYIETSFGFDTAAKTYSELIGNIERDAASAKKYWHFIRLMGRSASHITLECALQCAPNVALISEEAAERSMTLADIVEVLCASITSRASAGMNYGVVLVPEGLIEFIPDMKKLIAELNDILAKHEADIKNQPDEKRTEYAASFLSAAMAALYASLPADIQRQLIMDRDPHGNVQVSRIETEKLLIAMVEQRLAAYKAEGTYAGSFNPLTHFFGYEGRAAFPSNFDADYCYALGYSACLLAVNGFTGYIACVRGLARPVSEWKAGGIALTSMMHVERRHGNEKPVIRKALVDLAAAPFKRFAEQREGWARENCYRYPGAIQYYGPTCDETAMTLRCEHA